LSKANQIIEQQKVEIKDLKNKLNTIKNIDLNEIKTLKTEITIKDNQLNQLRRQLQNNNSNNNETKIINISDTKFVSFISNDKKILNIIPCIGDETFAEIEEILYRDYPQLRETNNTFFLNDKEILRFKTINDNKIENGKQVLLIKPSELHK
jgi:alanyl-tRNA synthetase